MTYSLKLARLKLRLKLRYIIQQLAFRRQNKVTHLMAETFKHNLMFLNNSSNDDDLRSDSNMGATNIGEFYKKGGNMGVLREDITKGYCQLDESERDAAWVEYLDEHGDEYLQSKAKPAAKSGGGGVEDTTDEDMFGTNTTPPAEPLIQPDDWNESVRRDPNPQLEAAVCALGAALKDKKSFTKEWGLLLEHRCYCSYNHEDDPDNKAVRNLEVPIAWPSYLEFSNNTPGVTRAKKPSSLKLLRQYLKYALRLGASEGPRGQVDVRGHHLPNGGRVLEASGRERIGLVIATGPDC